MYMTKKIILILLLTNLGGLVSCSKNNNNSSSSLNENGYTLLNYENEGVFETNTLNAEKEMFIYSKSDYDTNLSNVDSIDDELKNKFINCDYDSYFYIISPFKFSSSEKNISLKEIKYNQENLVFTFSLEAPEYCDSDIRWNYYVSKIEKKYDNDVKNKQIDYHIENNIREGSCYYNK